MKIREVMDINDGIFKAIQGKLNFIVNGSEMDLEWIYGLSGNKETGSLIDGLLEANKATRLSHDDILLLSNIILNKFKDKWEKTHCVLLLDYNPIENYNRVETHTGTDTDRSDGTNTTTATGERTTNDTETLNETYGFGSNEAIPSSRTKTQTGTDSKTTDTTNNTLTKTYNTTSQTSGNIGVTTTQQMIESEIKLREYNLINEMYKDVDSVLTSGIYCNEEIY